MEKPNENLVDLWEYVEKHKPQIEKSLREHLPLAPPKIETEFNEAIEYVLFSGDEKRLRPVLTLLGAELFGGKAEDVLPSAAAVEFIRASSLIFGDLPCMSNNADSGRGKKSLNSKFGEGLAILVALGFLNASYPLVFVRHIGMPERAMQAHAEIVECVGASGLVGGQSFGLAKSVDSADLADDDLERESIRNLKTSALMRLALRVGAILAGADYLDLSNLSRFAELLGDAYQLSDDLVDLEEDDKEILSKDDDSEKTSALDQDKESAQHKLNDLVKEAKGILFENFPSNKARSCLIQLTEYLAERSF